METTSEKFIPYSAATIQLQESEAISESFFQFMRLRRSVRDFTKQNIPDSVLKNILNTAYSAPSESNKQPWTFCVVKNPSLKKKIRLLAEEEDFMNKGTSSTANNGESFAANSDKKHLEESPCLIVVFKKSYDIDANGNRHNNYYVKESAGISIGFLLTAAHHAGLAAITHAPSPINHLKQLLNRPDNEKPYLMISLGYPAENAKVPNIRRKEMEELTVFYH